jgi:predicted nucleic acid-binding Zn finger protein
MNQAALSAAIETARRKVAGNAAWSRSVEKAAQALLSGEIIVTVLANNGGVVTSTRGAYHVRHGFCSCPAAMNGCNHCYLVSALRIAIIADELLRRFRVNTLDYLAEDMLRGVLAVCA